MENIALFGGSFDPPHIGHKAIINEALKLKEIEKVVVMPTYLNPFKSSSHAPSVFRLEWLKKNFSSLDDVEISSFEVNLKRKVPSIESVKYLLKRYKKVYLIIGADNLKSLPKWESYNELKKLVTFVVASRDKIDVPEDFLTLNVKEEISSTSLRKEIDREKLLPKCVEQITKFYKENNAR